MPVWAGDINTEHAKIAERNSGKNDIKMAVILRGLKTTLQLGFDL